ncbi:MAG: Ig-like domain-containing protein, partial [candidate division WOR-3 bacterium]
SFLLEEKPTDYVWTDVNNALRIYDYTCDMEDTSITVGAVDSVTVNADNFKIIEENSGKETLLGKIDYTGNPGNSDFGRVLIKPAEDLEPESWYVLKVLGGIADSSGNKMGEDSAVVFERRFKAFSCNYDSSDCVRDTTAPAVLEWRNLGAAFEVSFSELIAPESVTDSSVYVPRVKGELFLRNECGQTFVRFVSSRRVSFFGRVAYITGGVVDIAGNKIKEVDHYFER